MGYSDSGFLAVYDQYGNRVRHFIRKLVKDEWAAEDILQETFIRVRQHLDELRNPSRLSSWLFRIALNLSIEHLRRQQKIQQQCDGGTDVERIRIPDCDSVQKATEQHEMSLCVRQYLNLLPESLYTVLVLYDMLNYTHRDIANLLDITVANAKVRLHRARKRIGEILRENCAFEKDERNVMVCVPRSEQIGISAHAFGK